MSELLNILCFDCGENLGIVGAYLLIGILREETLYAEGVIDFHVDLILVQHSSW